MIGGRKVKPQEISTAEENRESNREGGDASCGIWISTRRGSWTIVMLRSIGDKRGQEGDERPARYQRESEQPKVLATFSSATSLSSTCPFFPPELYLPLYP